MQRNIFMFERVNAPYASVHRILRDQPGLVLAPSALVALQSASDLVARLDAEVAGITLTEEVDIDFGEFEDLERGMIACTRAVSWAGVDHPDWFPRFEGEFEAYPLTPTSTQLTFVGRYTPPGGLVGGIIDVLALHRIADASLQSFFEHAAQRLGEVAAPTLAP